jgi:hypothetical protein
LRKIFEKKRFFAARRPVMKAPGAFYGNRGGGNPFTAGWTVVAITYAGFGLAFIYGRRTPLKGDYRRPITGKSARQFPAGAVPDKRGPLPDEEAA